MVSVCPEALGSGGWGGEAALRWVSGPTQLWASTYLAEVGVCTKGAEVPWLQV